MEMKKAKKRLPIAIFIKLFTTEYCMNHAYF